MVIETVSYAELYAWAPVDDLHHYLGGRSHNVPVPELTVINSLSSSSDIHTIYCHGRLIYIHIPRSISAILKNDRRLR